MVGTPPKFDTVTSLTLNGFEKFLRQVINEAMNSAGGVTEELVGKVLQGPFNIQIHFTHRNAIHTAPINNRLGRLVQ